MDAAPQVEADVVVEPVPVQVAPATPEPAAPQPSAEIGRLEAEAKATAEAAYEAYNPGHGKLPAQNAGELHAKAAQAQANRVAAVVAQALAAAKGE